jgi:hypothetical protein
MLENICMSWVGKLELSGVCSGEEAVENDSGEGDSEESSSK